MSAPERVRLVIWDLDETFWLGTLSEGGITYQQHIHDLVISLAQRGIISSICSKNDFERVKSILVQHGIWDYFVFPSIDWSPKGPRLAAMIETFGLRAPTVLFVDDNHLNRAEALHFLPDLQVEDETIISGMLDDWRFSGKDDIVLSRLQQYKLLERKNTDQKQTGNNEEFLRSSNIRVIIEHDVAANIDRAIELINRTNQLNYTKKRLPEDAAAARAELGPCLARYDIQAGLIRVVDNYGDYGFVGLYVMEADGRGTRLVHFCFSCRTLGMQVERWVYDQLGRPELAPVGEVLTDLQLPILIDWISTDSGTHAVGGRDELPPFFARGGCDLSAVAHYFEFSSPRVAKEFVIVREGLSIRYDHSALLRYAAAPPAPAVMGALESIGYRAEDITSALFGPDEALRVFSCWADPHFNVYRHKATGCVATFDLPGIPWGWDFVSAPMEHIEPYLTTPVARDAIEALKRDFECLGKPSEMMVRANLRCAFEALKRPAVMLLSNDSVSGLGLPPEAAAPQAALNAWTRAEALHYPLVALIPVRDLVHDDCEVHDLNHFDRMVYFRIAERLKGRAVESRRAG